jgi:hypothetical protein
MVREFGTGQQTGQYAEKLGLETEWQWQIQGGVGDYGVDRRK